MFRSRREAYLVIWGTILGHVGISPIMLFIYNIPTLVVVSVIFRVCSTVLLNRVMRSCDQCLYFQRSLARSVGDLKGTD